ncbi:MAG TPA: hypothetical protein VHE30_05805 [Polyangiaceae bacterium]|nr:hypothetical protein [Polyangiaceae bacterium]
MRRKAPLVPMLALAVGLLLVWAYAWVLDDAFVYFRYADNAALLHAGLVFNQGEHVEGFTSPLWMLLWVAVRALGFRHWPVLLALGWGSLAATWALAIFVNRRLSGSAVGEFHLPALFVAGAYAVLSHFTSGLETPFVQVVALAFAALVLAPRSRLLAVAVGLGPLVRPELNLAVLIGSLWCLRQNRAFPWWLVGTALGGEGAWLAFRVYYYSDLFPNTFYLKDAPSALRGFRYLHDTLRAHYLYEILGAGLAGLAFLRRFRPEVPLLGRPRAVLFACALLHAAYVVRIGGDFVHYRYLAFPVLVAVAALGGVVERILEATVPSRRFTGSVLGVPFFAALVCSYPRVLLPSHPLFLRPAGDSLKLYRVNGIEDAASHRHRFDIATRVWDRRPADVTVELQGGKLSYQGAFAAGWCLAAYDHPNWFVVQSFGLTDPVMAHLASPPSGQAGHRWAIEPLARDLALARTRLVVTPGLDDDPAHPYRVAAKHGWAAPWILRNLDAIDVITERTEGPRGFGLATRRIARGWPEMVVGPKDVVAVTNPIRIPPR